MPRILHRPKSLAFAWRFFLRKRRITCHRAIHGQGHGWLGLMMALFTLEIKTGASYHEQTLRQDAQFLKGRSIHIQQISVKLFLCLQNILLFLCVLTGPDTLVHIVSDSPRMIWEVP